MDRLTGKDAQLMMEALATVYEKKGDCVDKDKKTKHNCAKKVCSEQWGEGTCVPEHHTLLEDGTVTHYDVVFEHGLERMVPIQELEVLVTEMHEHAAMEGEVLDENRGNRAAQLRADREARAASGEPTRAQQQLGSKPIPTGNSRRFARRSSSAAARANTNKVGQNIKVGSPTGPAQNDQLKKPTPTVMANKAPAQSPTSNLKPGNPNVVVSPKSGEETKFERRLPTMAELRAAQDARKAAASGGASKQEAEYQAVKAGVNAGKPAPKPAAKPAPKPAAKPAAAVPAPAKGARNRMRMEELDVFDTIKEYLIGEGATEEEALNQMLTLTDEQRTEIIEGSCGSKKKKKSKKGGY